MRKSAVSRPHLTILGATASRPTRAPTHGCNTWLRIAAAGMETNAATRVPGPPGAPLARTQAVSGGSRTSQLAERDRDEADRSSEAEGAARVCTLCRLALGPPDAPLALQVDRRPGSVQEQRYANALTTMRSACVLSTTFTLTPYGSAAFLARGALARGAPGA